MCPSRADITDLLLRFRAGDREAESRLVPLIYKELRRMARGTLKSERNAPLDATELVHEAFLRIASTRQPLWRDRKHFFGIVSRVMRQVLVDHARQRQAQKRGGGAAAINFDSAISFTNGNPAALVELDRALKLLAARDPRAAKIVEMKFFGGLNVDEIGEALEISARTVKREWTMARAWLHRQIVN